MRYLSAFIAAIAVFSCSNSYAGEGRLPEVTNTAHYVHRLELFRMMPASENPIVFLGDSLIERCDWAELFGDPSIKNRGISGDTTSGILYRLNDITKMKPRRIFLLVGLNDIFIGDSAGSISDNYGKVIGRLRASLPGTEIIVLSVLPTAKGRKVNGQVEALNRRLERLANTNDVQYVDLYSLLNKSPDGLGPSFSMDGVHLTGEAYGVIKKALSGYVR
ncbi:MAG: hypothetical protein HZA22_09295 [Nitrospirae bacterium]|nr:hypothetical protein [Nitrospirota bacterium]MBI5696786.1 hypothetical protein [Nitrospirota bacterium]